MQTVHNLCSHIRRQLFALFALGLMAALLLPTGSLAVPEPHVPHAPAVASAFVRLPLSFVPNYGQTDPSVRYMAHGDRCTVFLTDRSVVTTFLTGKPDAHGAAPAHALACTLTNARPGIRCCGEAAQKGKASYFIGNDASRWHTNLAAFGRVRYHSVYKGIDLVFYGNQRRLEYDFVVAPGAQPAKIAWSVAGTQSEQIDANGDLVLTSLGSVVRWHRPIAYQQASGRKQPVVASFRCFGHHRVGFTVGHYDVRRPLVIDPVLIFSTYLAGYQKDEALSVAVDASNNAYVCGWTSSSDFPAHVATDTKKLSLPAAFVVKMDYFGADPIYSVYLSGNDHETGAQGIAVDAQNHAYVTGYTNSPTFPVTSGAFQNHYQTGTGSYRSFVCKFNVDGNDLIFSTYLSGANNDSGNAIAVDPTGACAVVGVTTSADFPTTSNAFQKTLPYFNNYLRVGSAFVSRLSANGAKLTYSTYLGGSSDASDPISVFVDAGENVYVAGNTAASDFPTTPGVVAPKASYKKPFVTKFGPKGGKPIYSTYLGEVLGSDNYAEGMAVDTLGNAYIAGFTTDYNYPTTVGSFQPTVIRKGRSSAFLTKLNPTATAYVYSTFLAGSYDDYGESVAVDAYGSAYVGGTTDSGDFPVTRDAFQPQLAGFFDAFVTKVNPEGNALLYSTFLGGSATSNGDGYDRANSVAVDPVGNVYAVGLTQSENFPTTKGAFDQKGKNTNGAGDAFVSRLLIYSPTVLLWVSQKAQANVWTIDNAGVASRYTFGPIANAKPIAVSIGPDSHVHLLWTYAKSGTASVWDILPNGTYTHKEYMAGTGWSCISLCTSIDNASHLLWINATGAAQLWRIAPSGQLSGNQFAATPGWTAVAICSGPLSFTPGGPEPLTRILWRNPMGGQMSLWLVDHNGRFTHHEWTVVTGWTPLALSAGSDGNTRVLYYDAPDDDTEIWTIAPDGTMTHGIPWPHLTGWKASVLAVGEENSTRVIWTRKSDGLVWDYVVDPFVIASYTAYPPVKGWSVQAIAAGY